MNEPRLEMISITMLSSMCLLCSGCRNDLNSSILMMLSWGSLSASAHRNLNRINFSRSVNTKCDGSLYYLTILELCICTLCCSYMLCASGAKLSDIHLRPQEGSVMLSLRKICISLHRITLHRLFALLCMFSIIIM